MKKRTIKTKTTRAEECSGCKAAKICGIFVAIILASIGIFGSIMTLNSAKAELKKSFNYELRTAVEVAAGSVNAIYDRYAAGDLSQEQASSLALATLKDTAWNDGRRGFWVLDTEGNLLIADEKNSAMDLTAGSNVWNTTDSNGRYFLQDFVAAASNGGGYVEFAIDNNGWNSFVGYAMPTEFNFVITANYDLAYFDRAAYPETRNALWWSVILLTGLSFIAIGCYAFALVHER